MKFIALLALLVGFDVVRGEDVIEVHEADFEEFINSNDLVLVTFYSKSCPHCKEFEPSFSEAATKSKLLKRPYSFGRVEVYDEPLLSAENEIRVMPTVRLFAMGSRVRPDYERNSESIMTFLDDYAKGLFKSLELFDPEEILSKRNTITPQVIFVGEEKLEIYKEATDGFQEIKFYHISPKLGKELFPNLKQYPAIILYKGFDEKEVIYNGEIEVKKIKEFVEDNRFPRVRQFDDRTVGQIFKSNGMKAVILFIKSEDELSNLIDVFHKVATERRSKEIYFITADPSIGLGKRVATNIGIEEEDTPIVIILERKKEMEVYPFKGNYNKNEIESFIDEWKAGKAQTKVKSENIPKDNKGPVKIVVGKTFEKEVLNFDGSVLVNVCIPSRKDCRDFEALYNDIATKTNIKVVTINPAKNYMQNINMPNKYPTLLLFFKRQYKVYEGELIEGDILDFINTGNLDPSKRIDL